MDWNSTVTFVSRQQQQPSLNSLYNHNYDQDYPGMEMKNLGSVPGMERKRYKYNINNKEEKKKRLRNDQLERLEMSFEEDTKLEPDRKMKLSKELGLQPRQIAIWFQNRRARWKAKELERLYDALKQQFHVVSREKQKLQDKVMKLKGILSEQSTRNQVSTGYTEISEKETLESTSIRCSNKPLIVASHNHYPIGDQCNCIFNMEEYNPNTVSPYSDVQLPSYP